MTLVLTFALTILRSVGEQESAQTTKKATGRITFVCNDGDLVKSAIEKAVETGEGQTVWMKSVGINKDGVEVSSFNFEWTVKVKK